jgi:hypothetical protein
MIESQASKFAPAMIPASIAGGATVTPIIIDTDGFSYATLNVFFGLVGANGVTTCKWQESVNADGSSATDIPNAAFTGIVDASDGGCYRGFLKLGGARKRYLRLSLVNGATNATLAAAWADLSQANQTPDSASERGLAAQFIV